MQNVNIYIYSNNKSPKKRKSGYGYILELIREGKEPCTLSKIAVSESSAQYSSMLALLEALRRLSKICTLTIYTESKYIENALLRWMPKWKTAQFLNAKGEPIAYQEEWEEISSILSKNQYRVLYDQEHTYREWLHNETNRKEQSNV